MFQSVKQRADQYAFSSFTHLTRADVTDCVPVMKNDRVFMMMNKTDKPEKRIVYWAANDGIALTEALIGLNQPVRVSFVPEAWKALFQRHGFEEEAVLKEYWLQDLERFRDLPQTCSRVGFKEIDEISRISKACKGLSRGFTGEEPEFFSGWIKGSNPNVLDVGASEAAIIGRKQNNHLLGFACVAIYGEKKKETLWIREIAVEPAEQHQGHGLSLMESALKYGCDHQARRAFLMVDAQNQPALSLYEKVGFCCQGDETEISMVYNPSSTVNEDRQRLMKG